MRSQSDILEDIANFKPMAGSWLPLDNLLNELWLAGEPSVSILPTLFGVFERFPADDGAGVLWSIVHGVEALPYNYEPLLRESYSRTPSEMARIMLARLAKSSGAA
ncbi:hypothetical protein OR60_16180 [Xanthomonas vesicatoria]|uniref:Uncharacterized protein n=1 Tax=Xanthomonas vesicatoria TaxID=56460 RepID=A0AAJ0IZB6_9XANT|nr:hypothetical protein BI313_17415 [Xanthomonas vesicatoria]KHM92589.1 hypothetical protein OR60_16180 [Xanthomonas vesicatoria]KHM95092.1 hypothetical protein OR61_09680 [Xanthomonas vesicatoria]